MKITPGIGFSEASGSVAGVTYKRSKGGLTMAIKSPGPAGQSSANRIQRTTTATAAIAWRGLGEDRRRQWNAAAKARMVAGYPEIDNGFHLFVAVTNRRRDLGLGIQVTPSADAPGTLNSLNFVSLVAATGLLTYNATWFNSPSTRLLIWATSTFPASWANAKHRPHRLIGFSINSPTVTTTGIWRTAWFTPTNAQRGMAVEFWARVVHIEGAQGPLQVRRLILT
jgi:hypothetical protein